MKSQIITQNFYDRDYCLWLDNTVKLLGERKFEELDVDNLIEEIEGMSRSERRELKNRLIVLLVHLLKWKYQTEKRSDSWLNTIDEQRRQIVFLLEDSPSLRSYCLNILDICYQMARKDAIKQTKLPENTFSEIFCFTIEQVLDFDYLPEKI